MHLLHPWYLIGLAAVGLPFAVHYLTRPHPRVLPLSTIRFVREAVQQRRARHRLRDLLVLLLRGAAVVLLALTFARPLIGARHVPALEPGNAVRVVVVDQSQSMAAVANGVQAFERARTAAAAHLAYSPGLQADLILAAARPRTVFGAPSSNFTALREALASAHPRSEVLNLKAAIDAAADLLAKAPPGQRRELFVVSDFQRSNWVAADFSPLPKDTSIELETVAPRQTPANLAILRVGAQGRIEQGREAKLEVEVGNYSATAREVQVELSVAGAIYRLSGHCSSGVTTILSTDVIPSTGGWQGGEAKLVEPRDALAADDARSFVLNVRPPLTYLLITREPSRPQPVSSQFLERALAPLRPREGQRGERVVRIDPDSLDREAVGAADVIVIDHPGRIRSESIQLMASVLRRGRAMLYVTAEPIDASNLTLLADAAGADLKMPVQFVPPPPSSAREGLFIASTRGGQSVFSAFGENLGAALTPLRFAGGLDSRKLETGLADDLLATFSDRTACLVVTRCGAGRLGVLNADLGRSNLVASPIFVPLVSELVARLLAREGITDQIASGEPTVSDLPPEVTAAAGLSIVGPDGAVSAPGALIEESGLVAWRWDEAGPSGVYQVKRGNSTVFALATGIPAAESDLTTIDPTLLTGRLAGGRTVHFRPAEGDQAAPETAWSWILVVCVGCMLLEVVTLKLFRA